MRTSTTKNKILSFLFWMVFWSLLSFFLDNKLLLPSPFIVIQALLKMIKEAGFWSSIFNSIIRILIGLFLGIVLGICLAIISYSLPELEEFINLPVDLIKSTPIASITILLLIWVDSNELVIFIVSFIVLPNIYHSSLIGLLETDRKLLEMAYVFKVSKIKQIRFIYLDQIKNFLLPSIMASTGLAWKSGISAEVLGLVSNSIGENIYYSKLYLNTADLFTWTLIIVLISKVFQKVIGNLMERMI